MATLKAFLSLNFSFMVWTMFAPLSTEITESLYAVSGFTMDPSQKATLLSTPLLAGAFLTILFHFSMEIFTPKKTTLMAQSVVIIALFYTFFRGEHISYDELLVVAFGLGFAGASFAVALPQTTQWNQLKIQGVVIHFIFAPKIAELWGWQTLFLINGILSTLIFATYLFLEKAPTTNIHTPLPKKLKDYAELLKDKDTWWFGLFYAVSFGGFIGFANYIKVYLMNTYQADMSDFGLDYLNEANVKVVAGYFGAFIIFAGTILYPIGKILADKMDGVKSLYIFFSVVTFLTLLNCCVVLPFWVGILVLFFIMASLGMANSAVFQLIAQKFGKDKEILIPFIVALGALGGGALVQTLGYSKEAFFQGLF